MTKRIDTDAISSRPEDRLRFLEEFVGFSDDDWTAVRQSAEVLVPQVDTLLDEFCGHLAAFDETRRLLGPAGEADPVATALRRRQVANWLRETLSASVEDRAAFASYLNVVGRHAGGSVAPRYLVGLAGFVQLALTRAIHGALPDEPERALRMSAAWNKMVVVQLEMFLKNVAPQWPSWDEPSNGPRMTRIDAD